jgi:hypothetical protein
VSEEIDAAKVEALVDALRTALPELVTIAFTRFKAELHRIVPGLSDDEWGKLKREEDQRRAAGRVVKFPDVPPKWATPVDAKMLDWLIARGYLQHSQRHNWCAVEMAVNNVIYEHK